MSSYTKYHKKYFETHKTEVAARTKKWVAENRETFLEKQKKYNEKKRNRKNKTQPSTVKPDTLTPRKENFEK